VKERIRVITDSYCNACNDGGQFVCVYLKCNEPMPGRYSQFVPMAWCKRHNNSSLGIEEANVQVIRHPNCLNDGFDCYVELEDTNE